MIFTETRFTGVFVIELDKKEDERGFFARSWCQQEFDEHGLNPQLVQCNISYNAKKGTLRGMHYQVDPYSEAKIVRCTRGAIYDVILDLRPTLPTYKQWLAVNLTEVNYKMLYIPEGLAHGFQTLDDETEVFYQMSEFHHPECARGIRWNDPAFGIDWPLVNPIISEKDKMYRDFKELL
jgi:dTDP-4-dehydrorhamnose 3,5-epimerase